MVPGERTRTRHRNLQCRYLRWTRILSSPGSVAAAERRLAGIFHDHGIFGIYLGNFVAEIFSSPCPVFLAAGGRAKLYFVADGLADQDRWSTPGCVVSAHGSQDDVGFVLDPGMLRLHHAAVPVLATFLSGRIASHVACESQLVYLCTLRLRSGVGIAYRETQR